MGNPNSFIRRFRKKRLLFVLIALLFVPIGIEIGARIIYAVRLDNTAYLHYPKNASLALSTIVVQAIERSADPMRLPPGQHDFFVNGRKLHSLRINQSGFRGRDFSDPKTAKWTIVTMGGSSTFSSECPEGTSYPEVMEDIWNSRYGQGTVEVVNRGMNRMTTHQVANLLSSEVVAHRPDMVMICSTFNGAEPPIFLDLRSGQAPLHRRILWRRSLFYTALHNSRMTKQLQHASTQKGTKEKYRTDLERMVDRAGKNGIRLVFIQQPMLSPDKFDKKQIAPRTTGEDLEMILNGFRSRHGIQQEFGEVMADVARFNQVAIVDPRKALNEAEDSQRHFWIALHLTPDGAKIMAKEIIRQLDEQYGSLGKLLK